MTALANIRPQPIVTERLGQFGRVLEAVGRDTLAEAFGASADAALTGVVDAWDAFDRIMLAGAERALAEIKEIRNGDCR